MLKALIILSLLAEAFEFKKYVVTTRDRKKVPKVETSLEPIEPVQEAGQDYSDMALDDIGDVEHDYLHHETVKCDCGKTDHEVHDYVIGGRVAKEKRYPWVVEVKTKKEDGWYNCGGSIITSRKVLSLLLLTFRYWEYF